MIEYRDENAGPETSYKILRKKLRKFKMQQITLKINKKIQNDSPEFNIVGAISDTFVTSDLRNNNGSEF